MYSRINTTRYPASDANDVGQPSRTSARSRVRVDQCVSAVAAVKAPVLVCLRSGCDHVTV